MRRLFVALAAVLGLLAGVPAATSTHPTFSHPAFAAGLTGVCDSYDGTATCLRADGTSAGAAVRSWNRDICCDGLQQWTVKYTGEVVTCQNGRSGWPFSDCTFNSRYATEGVFEFVSVDSGLCAGNGVPGTNITYLMSSCDPPSTLYFWDRYGALINAGQTNYWDQEQVLYDPGAGHHTWTVAWTTLNCGFSLALCTWTQVHV